MLHHRGDVRGVMVHVVTIGDLARAAMAAPIMGDDAIAVTAKYSICVSQSSRGQRPAVMEDDGLPLPGPQSLK